MEVVDRIYILTHKKMTGVLTPKESLELNQLLETETNKTIHDKIQTDWIRIGEMPSLSFDSASAFEKFNNKVNSETPSLPNRRLWLWRYSAVAASLVILLMFVGISHYGKLSSQVYSGQQVVQLNDGSKVHLSENAELIVSSDFNDSRSVELNGEAVFEVEKSTSSFTVVSDETEIVVLGTTFYVDVTTDIKKVKVLEGKVKVINSINNDEAILNDKDQVAVQKNGSIVSISDVSFGSNFYDPELVYDNTPIFKVFSDLEVVYGVEFMVKKTPSNERCKFTSKDLDGMSIDDILMILEATFGMKIEKNNEGILVVRRLSCR